MDWSDSNMDMPKIGAANRKSVLCALKSFQCTLVVRLVFQFQWFYVFSGFRLKRLTANTVKMKTISGMNKPMESTFT